MVAVLMSDEPTEGDSLSGQAARRVGDRLPGRPLFGPSCREDGFCHDHENGLHHR